MWGVSGSCQQTCKANLQSASSRAFYEKRQQLAESGLKKVLPVEIDADFVEDVRRSLYTAKIAAYAQGLALYKSASETYDWNLNLGDIASIFRAGCIIQARFLNNITNISMEIVNSKKIILVTKDDGSKFDLNELLHTTSAKFLLVCAGENFCGFISYSLTFIPLLAI